MTRPIVEPSPLRKLAGSQWDVEQLQRRPTSVGISPGVWYDADLIAPWVNAGSPYHDVQWRVVVSSVVPGWNVELRGSATDGGVGDPLFQLPDSILWPPADVPLPWGAGTDDAPALALGVVKPTGYLYVLGVFECAPFSS